MALWGDYHTHTVYSRMHHGKGTVEQNVAAAVNRGLKEIGLSDHGLRHRTYGLKESAFSSFMADIRAATIKYPQIKVYASNESDIISERGDIDMTDKVLKRLDYLIMGYHKIVRPRSIKDFWNFFMPNYISKDNPVQKSKNTDAYVKALINNKIDIISHPLRDCPIDLYTVGTVAAKLGVYIELNGKRVDMTAKQINMLADLGCEFILSSDAHSPKRVGDVAVGLEAAKAAGLPMEKIANWDRLPTFRSSK